MCKELQFEDQLRFVEQYGSCIRFLMDRAAFKALSIDDYYKRKMIHGPAAACKLCHDYQIHQFPILEAIALHTIADELMSPLAKIVFIADKLEPTRERAGNTAQELQFLDLDSLFVYTLGSVIEWFTKEKENTQPLHG